MFCPRPVEGRDGLRKVRRMLGCHDGSSSELLLVGSRARRESDEADREAVFLVEIEAR